MRLCAWIVSSVCLQCCLQDAHDGICFKLTGGHTKDVSFVMRNTIVLGISVELLDVFECGLGCIIREPAIHIPVDVAALLCITSHDVSL